MPTLTVSRFDHVPATDGPAVTTRRTWPEVVLAIAILIESSRAMHIWYPAVGLIANDEVTTLGRLTWPVFALGSCVAIFRRPWLERRSLDPLMVATVALLSASFLWSLDGPKTLYQAIIFCCLGASGAFLAIAFSRDELVALVANTLGVICIVNVAGILIGVDDGFGTTTGFFEHKNILGIVSAAGLLCNVARIAACERGRLPYVFAAATAAALLLSGAKTALFGLLLAQLWTGFIAVRRHHQLAALALLAPAFGVYALAMRATGGFAAILAASGKSSDLTGRTDIWAEVTRRIGERPVVGWGYLAFWRDEGFDGGPSGHEMFGLRHAHNGYLDAALGAGVLAGVLLAVTLLAMVVRSYRRCVAHPSSIDFALFGMALFTATVNVSETLFPATTRTLLTLLLFALAAGPTMREHDTAVRR